MKKEITLGQLVSVGVSVLGAVLASWLTMNNKITRLETRQDVIEQRWQRVETKMDEALSAIYEVKIELQNKKNRE